MIKDSHLTHDTVKEQVRRAQEGLDRKSKEVEDQRKYLDSEQNRRYEWKPSDSDRLGASHDRLGAESLPEDKLRSHHQEASGLERRTDIGRNQGMIIEQQIWVSQEFRESALDQRKVEKGMDVAAKIEETGAGVQNLAHDSNSLNKFQHQSQPKETTVESHQTYTQNRVDPHPYVEYTNVQQQSTSRCPLDLNTFLAVLNDVRARPAFYADRLKLHFFKPDGKHVNHLHEPDYTEGSKIYKDGFEFLRRVGPLPPLRLEQGLVSAALDQAIFQANNDRMSFLGPKNENVRDRVSRYGRELGVDLAENTIKVVELNYEIIILSMIIDDGVPTRSRRLNIFDPRFTKVGLAASTNKVNHFFIDIVFASEGFISHGAAPQQFTSSQQFVSSQQQLAPPVIPEKRTLETVETHYQTKTVADEQAPPRH